MPETSSASWAGQILQSANLDIRSQPWKAIYKGHEINDIAPKQADVVKYSDGDECFDGGN